MPRTLRLIWDVPDILVESGRMSANGPYTVIQRRIYYSVITFGHVTLTGHALRHDRETLPNRELHDLP